MRNFRDLTVQEVLDVLEQKNNIQFSGNANDFGLVKIDESIDTSENFNITPNIKSEAVYLEHVSAATAYNGSMWQKFSFEIALNSGQLFARKVGDDEFVVNVIFPPAFL